MRELLLICLLCGGALWLTPARAEAQDASWDEGASRFKAGQVWSYKTREGERDSTVVVLKIQDYPKLGRVVHVSVLGLKMKKPNRAGEFIPTINHMPLSEEAFAASVEKLLKEKAELPDYESGYSLWREEFDAKRAGVHTSTIAEAVQFTEEMLNQPEQ
jgi:hypothetical protein